MQFIYTCTFLIAAGWVGQGLTGKVGKWCLTAEGGQGVCVKGKTCPAYAKPFNQRHLTKQPLEHFIAKYSCSGPYVCCQEEELPTQIQNMKCGVRKTGARSNWPWLATIKYGNRNICSGSLISSRHILTSAMCVNAGPPSVVLGHSYASGPKEFNVSQVDIHPEFDLETFSNNLAVVKLSQEVDMREAVLPLCLPTAAEHKGVFIEAGWATFENGDDTIVSRAVEAIDRNECQVLLDETEMDFVNFSLGPSLLCTMDQAHPEACVGDLGGPLVRRNSNTDQFEIVGVRTIPLMCGPYGGQFPEIYTDLKGFMTWIKNIVEQ